MMAMLSPAYMQLAAPVAGNTSGSVVVAPVVDVAVPVAVPVAVDPIKTRVSLLVFHLATTSWSDVQSVRRLTG